MTRTYRLLRDQDEMSTVEVGISEGLPGELSATVGWPDKVTVAGLFPAGQVGPMPVPEALEYAETTRSEHEYPEVAVLIEDRSLWQAQWGELVAVEDADTPAEVLPVKSDAGRNFVLLGVAVMAAIVPAAMWLRRRASRLVQRR